MLPIDPVLSLRVSVLNKAVVELLTKQDYRAAIPKAEELVSLAERAQGPRGRIAAVAWNNLGCAYSGAGDLHRATDALQHAAEIHAEVLGPQHPEYGVNLSQLGEVYREMGDYPRAVECSAKALAILESALGASHPHVGRALNNLSQAYMFSGDFVTAEPLLRRSLRIATDEGSEQSVAVCAKNLADVLFARGQYRQAAELYANARSHFGNALGNDHPLVATALVGLADALKCDVDVVPFAEVRAETYREVEAMLRRARAIYEGRLGPGHPHVAFVDNRLAVLALGSGRAREALNLSRATAERLSATLGPEHPETLKELSNVAAICVGAGELDEAERRYREVLRIAEHVCGAASRTLMVAANNLSAVYLAEGKIDAAIAAAEKASGIEDALLDRVLRSSPDNARRAFVGSTMGRLQFLLSLHADFAPESAAALSLALTGVLRRKGRALEASADVMRTLRGTLAPEVQRLFDEYRGAASEFSAMALRDRPADAAQRVEVEQRLARIEAELSAESQAFRRAVAPPATIEAVQAALGRDAALVEFVKTIPYRVGRGGGIEQEWDLERCRYVAYVVRQDVAPSFVELGSTDLVDDLCLRFRKALAARSPMVGTLARQLDERLMQPVRGLLGPAKMLHLSPDGPLNLIPFAALRDESDQPLLLRYLINYVDSGRVVLQFGATDPPSEDAVVFADPDFGAASATAPEFASLPGTAAEGRALVAILPGVVVRTGPRATKAALVSVHGPRILHLATHGFFVPRADSPAMARAPDRAAADAMVRSGVVLARANESASEGCITAHEILGMDLVGTRLAVLSACETGLVDVDAGDGVYGLRRALSIAGAQAQVLSLWKVADEATAELMAAYYGQLACRVPRAEALRRAQLSLMQRPDRAAPVFWAAFVSVGDPGPINIAEPLRPRVVAAPEARAQPAAFPDSFFLDPIPSPTLRRERVAEIPLMVDAIVSELYGIGRIEMRMHMMELEAFEGIGAVPVHLRVSLAQLADSLGTGRVGQRFRSHIAQIKRSRDVKGLSLLWQRAIEQADASKVPPPRPPAVDPRTLGPDEIVCDSCGGVQKRHYKFCLRCNETLPHHRSS